MKYILFLIIIKKHKFIYFFIFFDFNIFTLLNYNIMILTTTNSIEGCTIKEYKGIVTGETIIGANFIKDLKASITDFFWGTIYFL